MLEFSKDIKLSQLEEVVNTILKLGGKTKVFCFKGEMGSGKTTLINAICKKLGVTEPTSSPTYSIINEYKSKSGSIFHFDFYRLNSKQEAIATGCVDYFFSGHYCFIEWPEIIENLLPDSFVEVNVFTKNEDERTYQIKVVK